MTRDPSAVPDTVTWSQEGAQLLGDSPSTALVARDGQVRVSTVPPPFRPSSETRDVGFTVLGLPGAGVLATDGTYLYVKRWFNDSSTVYPGSDVFTRIGTGFNGSGRSFACSRASRSRIYRL